MRAPGEILLVACYELGHQPLSIAWPAAFLERAGYRPGVLDVSVEPLDAEKIRRARTIAVSVPMHTALRIGVAAAARIRALNPAAHIAFYGHYATLNADELLGLLGTLSWVILMPATDRTRVFGTARRLLAEVLGIEGPTTVDVAYRALAYRTVHSG